MYCFTYATTLFIASISLPDSWLMSTLYVSACSSVVANVAACALGVDVMASSIVMAIWSPFSGVCSVSSG